MNVEAEAEARRHPLAPTTPSRSVVPLQAQVPR